MSVQLYNAPLTSSYQATQPVLLVGESLVLDFTFTVTVAAKIAFYLEYTESDPFNANTVWSREVDEQDAGSGVVAMSQVVRTLQAAGGGNFGLGVSSVSVQLIRRHLYCRLQVQASVGTITNLLVAAPFGQQAVPAQLA